MINWWGVLTLALLAASTACSIWVIVRLYGVLVR